jgi:hypothetical protein
VYNSTGGAAWRNIPSRCCSSIRPASAHPATSNLSYMRLTRGPCLSCHAMSRTSERAADVSTAASLRLKDAKTLNARQPHSRFLDTDHHSLAYFRSCEYLSTPTTTSSPPSPISSYTLPTASDCRARDCHLTRVQAPETRQLTACFIECMKAPCKSSDSLLLKHPRHP